MTEAPVPRTTTTIVVGVDGSDSSRQALSWAVHYAALIGAEVDAVISWNYPTGYGIGAITADWNPGEDARTLLTKTVASVLGDDIPVPLTRVVREGNAAQVLLDETKDILNKLRMEKFAYDMAHDALVFSKHGNDVDITLADRYQSAEKNNQNGENPPEVNEIFHLQNNY